MGIFCLSFLISKNFHGDLGPPVPKRFRLKGGKVASESILFTEFPYNQASCQISPVENQEGLCMKIQPGSIILSGNLPRGGFTDLKGTSALLHRLIQY